MTRSQIIERDENAHAADAIEAYLSSTERSPLFLHGDAAAVLDGIPRNRIDCAMTSPPYWGHRAYSGGGIGLEKNWQDYIDNLLIIFEGVQRALKRSGSFWLNIGDAYQRKCLLGLPWRVAHAMTDKQGWILRNSVIWNKVKGAPDNAKDKLRNVYEHVFKAKLPESTLLTVGGPRGRHISMREHDRR